MKKLFALVLAAAMVLSMASVAFAAKESYRLSVFDERFCKNVDGKMDFMNQDFKYGDTLYLYFTTRIIGNDSDRPSFEDITKNFKLKAEWSKNEDLVESVEFKKVLADWPIDIDRNPQYAPDWSKKITNVAYVIAINTKEMPEAVDAEDVIGTITIDPKSNNFAENLFDEMGGAEEGEEYKFDVAFTLNVNEADIDKTENDDLVYNFKGNEDEEHEIELYAGMGMFVVNTYGQDKLVINTDVDYNEGIENAAPDANYVYFNSNNATFNRLGDLYLYADENDIVYKVNKDGSLTKLTPKYDEDEEAFVLRTRVIGSYVIAEEELPAEALVAGVDKAEPEVAPVAPSVPSNPSTGAAC